MSFEVGRDLFDKLSALTARDLRMTWAQVEGKAVASIDGFLQDVKEVTGNALDFDDMHLSTNGEGDAIMWIGLKNRMPLPLTIEEVSARLSDAQEALEEIRREGAKQEREVLKLTELLRALRIVEASKKEATE